MIFHPTPITFYLIGTLKLFEEACIVLGEKAKVVDSIFEVSDTLDTHTESITCIHIGIDVARSEVVRINHSTAEDLYPPGVLTEVAAFTSANGAGDIHLCARLGEREEGGTQTNFSIGPEHLACESEEHLLEIGETHTLVHIEAFDLMEEAVGTCGDSLVAIDSSWAEHADRRLVRLHIMSLVTGCMGTEQHVLGHIVRILRDEERILHVSCGVVCRKVEHGEDVLVVVDLGTMEEREAHALEDLDDLVANDGQRMACA